MNCTTHEAASPSLGVTRRLTGAGAEANRRSKESAVRFIKWTFGKAKESQLRVMSPLVFSGLRRLIRENAGNSDEAVSMKVLACTAMVPLCKRMPSLFCSNFPGT